MKRTQPGITRIVALLVTVLSSRSHGGHRPCVRVHVEASPAPGFGPGCAVRGWTCESEVRVPDACWPVGPSEAELSSSRRPDRATENTRSPGARGRRCWLEPSHGQGGHRHRTARPPPPPASAPRPRRVLQIPDAPGPSAEACQPWREVTVLPPPLLRLTRRGRRLSGVTSLGHKPGSVRVSVLTVLPARGLGI